MGRTAPGRRLQAGPAGGWGGLGIAGHTLNAVSAADSGLSIQCGGAPLLLSLGLNLLQPRTASHQHRLTRQPSPWRSSHRRLRYSCSGPLSLYHERLPISLPARRTSQNWAEASLWVVAQVTLGATC